MLRGTLEMPKRPKWTTVGEWVLNDRAWVVISVELPNPTTGRLNCDFRGRLKIGL